MEKQQTPINGRVQVSRDLAQWAHVTPYFWRQMRIGAMSHLFREPKSSPQGDIRFFFQKHYHHDPDPLIFDGAVDDYLKQAHPFLGDLGPMATVIDLGCGKGRLFYFLNTCGFDAGRYLGVDFAMTPTALDADADIVMEDFTDPDTVRYLDGRTVLFAVNTFCYVQGLDKIPLVKAAAKVSGNGLLVIEPWPGWFWDRHFDGIKPFYRFPRQLTAAMSGLGWMPQRQVTFYYRNIRGFYFLPLSYGILFSSGG